MQAGKLDRLIELQRRVLIAPDQFGQRKQSFETYAEVRASKSDQRSREFFAAQGTNAERVTEWRIRYRDDVLQTDRILHNGLSYDITHISEIGRAEGLALFASTAPQ